MHSNRSYSRSGRMGLPSSPASTRVNLTHERQTSQHIPPTRTVHRPQTSLPISPDVLISHLPETSRGSSDHAPINHRINWRDRTSYGSSPTDSSISTVDSISLNRTRDCPSDHSSRSSFNDNEQFSAVPGRVRKAHVEFYASADLVRNEQVHSERNRYPLKEGGGLWDCVIAAASVMTVNVNKAWSAKIEKMSGEETPPGHDSRLTRAMKAYHLTKARHPTDLPEWLFDERERRPALHSRVVNSQFESTEYDASFHRVPVTFSAFDNGILQAPQPRHARTQSQPLSNHGSTSSKTADRLRALRDAKRADLGVRHRALPSPEIVVQKPLPVRPGAF